jgi:hypothetical protein
VGVLYVRGLSAITAPADLVVPMGVDAFFTTTVSPALAAVAHATSLFDVLWFALIAIGLSRVTGMSRSTSVCAALLIWICAIFTGVVRALMFT